MNFQHLTITLLDGIYKAASGHVSTFDPQHAAETYLKILIEPLSPEARVWVNASFNEFGDHIYYEIFRPLADSPDCSLPLRKHRYAHASQAIAFLLAPSSSTEPLITPSASTVATRLRVVYQKPHELGDFLNLYLAISGPFEDIARVALTESIKAAERFLTHFNPYYYIAEIVGNANGTNEAKNAKPAADKT